MPNARKRQEPKNALLAVAHKVVGQLPGRDFLLWTVRKDATGTDLEYVSNMERGEALDLLETWIRHQRQAAPLVLDETIQPTLH